MIFQGQAKTTLITYINFYRMLLKNAEGNNKKVIEEFLKQCLIEYGRNR